MNGSIAQLSLKVLLLPLYNASTNKKADSDSKDEEENDNELKKKGISNKKKL